MTPDQAEAALNSLARDDPDRIFRTGVGLLREDYPELLLPYALATAKRFANQAHIQQLLGLAARASGESAIALQAFSSAAKLAPGDALIAHSHARAALEAGKPAVRLFERAITLAPNDGDALLGRAAARFHAGAGREAAEQLARAVSDNPLWLEGQRSLAHLRGQLGLAPAAVLEDCLQRHPASQDLHRLRVALHLEGRDLASAECAISEAQAAVPAAGWIPALAAHVASEHGRLVEADALFARAGPPGRSGDISLLARHLIRAGRPESASALIEPAIAQDRDHLLWPYLSLAWRMTGDNRWRWLEGNPRLIGIYDLQDLLGKIDGLADYLRQLHIAGHAPLDQSVRGGTQTDGNLLLRDAKPIRALRTLLLDTVATHIAQLPEAVGGHPTLIARRKPMRIAGSWSVRLRDAGFHVDHVHSQGWLSSAFYLALPGSISAPDQSRSANGWLSLGECRELVPGLEPERLIEPKTGRLVLFPSTMWHGTRPFTSGERLTVAFDIARPRQFPS